MTDNEKNNYNTIVRIWAEPMFKTLCDKLGDGQTVRRDLLVDIGLYIAASAVHQTAANETVQDHAEFCKWALERWKGNVSHAHKLAAACITYGQENIEFSTATGDWQLKGANTKFQMPAQSESVQ